MISDSILKFVTLLIDKVVVFAGLSNFTVSPDIRTAFSLVEYVFRQGVGLLSWLFPSEEIYIICVNLTIDLLTATLIFEIIALWLRIYKTVRR